MSPTTLRWMLIGSLLCVSLSGCGYFQESVADDDTELNELDGAESDQPSSEAESRLLAGANSPIQEGLLELKIKVGDRFPLSKRVSHRLTQTDANGISENTSQTDMMLSLVVEDVQPDGRKLLSVHYHRVKYDQDLHGKKVSYSSDRPGEIVPPEAMLYAGLAKNGFSFWIGPDNKVIELVGFNDFLRRCLNAVPPQHVAVVQRQLESTRSEDGVANFIDDSIGLLPYSNDPKHPGVAVKEGGTWELAPRNSDGPIPTIVHTQCMLKELTPTSAEILLSGRISGNANPTVIRTADGSMKIQVKGGQCTGTCRVDRITGLPTQSRVQRYLEIGMETSDGKQIQQTKESVSEITSFLSQLQMPPAGSATPIQQTNFQNAAGSESHRRVDQAGGARKF